MYVGPTLRRFGILLALLAVVISGCSLTTEDVAPDSTNSPDQAESPTAPSAPDAAESEQDEEPAAPTTAPPADTVDRQPEPDPAALTTLAGRIVYRDLDGTIAVSSPTGDDTIVLSDTTPLLRSQPTWSNDGSRVAWSSVGPSGPVVVLAESDGSGRTDIAAPTSPFYFSWSPEDTSLAALGPGAQGIELFLTNTDTTQITRIGSGQPFFFDWVDDNTLSAAISGTILTQLSVQENTSTDVELPGPLGAFQAPAALEPGQTLVALANSLNGNDVVIVGNGEARTVAQALGSVAFSVNPTDDRIAILVVNDAPQSQEIFFQGDSPPTLEPNRVSVVDSATGDSETLDIEDPIAVSWSPDGTTLAVLTVQAEGLEWVFVRDGATLPGDPFVPSQEFFNSYAPFAEQYERSSSWWSPDSQAIVFSGTIDGETGVWVDLVDDGRRALRIADGDIAQWSLAQGSSVQ